MKLKIPNDIKSPPGIEEGTMCIMEGKGIHVYLRGKFRKIRWYHRFLFLIPRKLHSVKGVDTLEYKEGDTLYLAPNILGGMTNIKPSCKNPVVIGTITKTNQINKSWRKQFGNTN